jgi:hypothetical protein
MAGNQENCWGMGFGSSSLVYESFLGEKKVLISSSIIKVNLGNYKLPYSKLPVAVHFEVMRSID